MASYVSGDPGHYRILSPADEDENFAERWNERPEKATAFFTWLNKAKEDYFGLTDMRGLDSVARSLELSCGKAIATRAMNRYGEHLHDARNSSALFATSVGLTYSASSTARTVPRHEFYGC